MIRLAPFLARRLDQLAQAAPERFADGPVVPRPLIGAVDDFAEDVVLPLLGGAVAPAHRRGGPVSLQALIDPFPRRVSRVQVVQHARADMLFDRVEHPAQKPRRLVRKAHAQERVDREGRIADPCIPVVPIPHSADLFRQGGRGRRDDRAVLEMIQQLERDGRSPDQSFLRPFIPNPISPATPGFPRYAQELVLVDQMMVEMAGAPSQDHGDSRSSLEFDGGLRPFQRNARPQVQAEIALSMAPNAKPVAPAFQVGSSPWLQRHTDPHTALHHVDRPQQFAAGRGDVFRQVGAGAERHGIGEADQAGVAAHLGHENPGIRLVVLPRFSQSFGRDGERASAGCVKNPAE